MENNALVRSWVSRSLRTFHVVLAVIAVGSHVVAGLSGEQWLTAFGEVVAIFGILHFIIHTNLHKKYTFSTDYHRTYSLPDKKIRRINAVFLIVLVLVVIFGMVAARELFLGTLLAKLKLLFMYLLNKGLGVVFSGDGLGDEEVLIQGDQSLLGALDGISRQDPNGWEAAANSIQTIVIIGGLVVFLVIGILLLVNLVRRMIASGGDDSNQRAWWETKDREESLGRFSPRRLRRLGSSPADRIRRIYQNCINRNRRRGQTVPAWMTPSEIESMVSLPDEDRYRELHTIYEKARYSESGSTDLEAQQAKSMKF